MAWRGHNVHDGDMTDMPNDDTPTEEPLSPAPTDGLNDDDDDEHGEHGGEIAEPSLIVTDEPGDADETDDAHDGDHAHDGDDASPRDAQDSLDGEDEQNSHRPPPFHPGPSTAFAAPPPMRRLYRSRDDRKLSGVSAGIAEFFGIDPTFVRLATLVFAVTGVGILAYLAAWVVVPLRPEGLVDAPRARPIADERTTTVAFGIAALALAFGIVTGSWAVLALALVGGGVWLLSQHAGSTPASYPASAHGASAPPGPPTAPYAYAPQQRLVDTGPYAATGGFPPPRDLDAEQSSSRERVPQRITWTVLSMLGLLTAVGAAAATGDWWDVSATRHLGAAVVIIALGVVVGQIRGGGARGLIPLGLLAALALFPVAAVDGLLGHGVGDRSYRPATLVELESQYEHGIGKMTVDLSQIDFVGQSETVDIELGLGEVIVIVSERTGGRAVLSARAGGVSHELPTRSSSLDAHGLNVRTGILALEGDAGELELNIRVGLGTAELRSIAE